MKIFCICCLLLLSQISCTIFCFSHVLLPKEYINDIFWLQNFISLFDSGLENASIILKNLVFHLNFVSKGNPTVPKLLLHFWIIFSCKMSASKYFDSMNFVSLTNTQIIGCNNYSGSTNYLFMRC